MQSNRAPHQSESGFVLLAVIFLTLALLISLAIAAPKIAQSIQRDRDLETIHRGEQYKRAIKLYYKKFGAYPTSIDQLVNTNDIRFLRKRYTDPLTGKDDWKPVIYGQAHVRPVGFFGQPLSALGAVGVASAVMGGTSGMYAITSTGTTDANGVPVAADSNGSTSADGTAASPSSAASSPMGGATTSTSPMGSSSPMGSMFGSSSPTSTSPTGTASSSPFGSSASGTSATSFGGGGPIVGVTLPVDKPSLVIYKKQKRYNQWEFNYDPIEDQMQAAASLFGGGAAAASSTSATTVNTMGTSGTTPGSSTTSSPMSPTSSSPGSSSPTSSSPFQQ